MLAASAAVASPAYRAAFGRDACAAAVAYGEANQIDSGDRVVQPRLDKVRDIDARVRLADNGDRVLVLHKLGEGLGKEEAMCLK